MAKDISRSCWQFRQVPVSFLFPFLTAALVLPFAAASVPALFIFGDDFVDVGTNNYLQNPTRKANFLPYGKDYIPASGRFSDGKLFVDYLAEYLGFTASPPPYLQPKANFSFGVNFASAGARQANPQILSPGDPDFPINQTVNAGRQLRQFRTFRRSRKNPFTKKQISRSLFLVCFGINDLELTEVQGAPNLPEAFGEGTAILAQVLHKFGARKIVLLNLPAAGCLPYPLYLGYDTTQSDPRQDINTGPIRVGKQCYAPLNNDAQGSNSSVFSGLRTFDPYPNSRIAVANFYSVTRQLHNRKFQLGFASNYPCCGAGFNKAQVQCGTNGNVNGRTVHGSACPNASKHWSWDGLGFTQKANELIAKAFWSGPQSSIWPMNISQIVAD